MQPMIRLRRGGKRHQASFRIVVAQKSEAADGDYLESLGTYNPRTQPSLIKLDAARALHWLHEGAQPSDTVRSILRRTGLWEKFHQGAGPDDLAPDEKTVFQGPEGLSETTSRRAEQAEASAGEAEAAEAETVEEEEAAAEAEAEPADEAVEEDAEAEETEEAEAAAEPEEPAAEAEADEVEEEEEPADEAAEEDEGEPVEASASDEDEAEEPEEADDEEEEEDDEKD